MNTLLNERPISRKRARKLRKRHGVIDCLEDGYVFGRLDDGTPFMCSPSDVEVIPAEPCEHGYDVACLICGFGSVDGERIWHSKK